MLNISTMRKYGANQSGTSKNQSGMASIFIVMILMAVLALISIGFSQLMSREVRQSLDRQLSAEAYFAAESGINDAKDYIANGGASFPGCATPAGSPSFVPNGNITGDNLIKYSCISVDDNPKELLFTLQPGETKIYKINRANIGRIYFSWQKNPTEKSFVALGSLGDLPRENLKPPNSTGILRAALYPVPNSINSNDPKADLSDASRNYFFYPETDPAGNGKNPGSVDFKSSNGNFVSGKCDSAAAPNLPDPDAPKRNCNAYIDNLMGFASVFYIRVTAMYTPLIGNIEVSNPPGNNAYSIDGNQSIIDVTGTGSDVSRRVRAIINTQPVYNNPANALWSMQAICKLFRVPVSDKGKYDPAVTEDSSGSGDSLCANATPNNGGGDINGVPNGGGGCTDPAGCPPTCGGDNCGGGPTPCGANASGNPCVCNNGYSGDPYAGCSPNGSNETVCAFDDGSYLYPVPPSPFSCRGVGGSLQTWCFYTDGNIKRSAC